MRTALLTAVLVPLFPVPATLFAQTHKPSQKDNIWAWHDDELAEAEVRLRRESCRHCAAALRYWVELRRFRPRPTLPAVTSTMIRRSCRKGSRSPTIRYCRRVQPGHPKPYNPPCK
jgi:hypothetical protein